MHCTIQQGDTLSQIAQRYGVTLMQLLQANPSINDANRIQVGEQIIIPPTLYPALYRPKKFGGLRPAFGNELGGPLGLVRPYIPLNIGVCLPPEGLPDAGSSKSAKDSETPEAPPERGVRLGSAPVYRKLKDKEEKVVECKLISALIKDTEGRVPARGLLEVVPPEIGETIHLEGEVEAGCGKHPEWEVGGYFNTTKKGAKTKFTANAWSIGKTGWHDHVSPHTYSISATACSGASSSFTVRAYPSDKLSMKVDGKMWRTAKDKLEYAIEKVLGAYLKEPKFQLLEGSCSGEAAWEEYHDHRAFYKYEASIGLNPIIGGKLRIPFGPMAAIPQWLKQYGDAYMFVEFSGGISANGHWGKKSPGKPEGWVTAKGNIDGIIGASVFLMDPTVMSAEVAGGTGISLEAEDAGKDIPTVQAELKWKGLMGTITVAVAWGIVEFQREFTVVKGGALHDSPFIWQLPFTD